MSQQIENVAVDSGAGYPFPKGWPTLNVRPVFMCGLAKML
jgi:hypothetical protein